MDSGCNVDKVLVTWINKSSIWMSAVCFMVALWTFMNWMIAPNFTANLLACAGFLGLLCAYILIKNRLWRIQVDINGLSLQEYRISGFRIRLTDVQSFSWDEIQSIAVYEKAVSNGRVVSCVRVKGPSRMLQKAGYGPTLQIRVPGTASRIGDALSIIRKFYPSIVHKTE